MRSLLLPHIHPVLNIISNFYIFQDCHSILFKINSSDPFALPLQLWPSKTSLILALQLLKTHIKIVWILFNLSRAPPPILNHRLKKGLEVFLRLLS